MKLIVDSTAGFDVDDALTYHDLQSGDTWTIPTTVAVNLAEGDLTGRSTVTARVSGPATDGKVWEVGPEGMERAAVWRD